MTAEMTASFQTTSSCPSCKLHILIDRNREGGLFSRNVPGDHDCSTKFTEPPGEGKQRPARIPRRASGSVIVRKTRHSEAPRLRAICSSSRSTDSIATRAVRTSIGIDITASAKTTPRHVKTTPVVKDLSNQLPMAERLPNNRSSTNPVRTGGRTNGSAIKVSTMTFAR